MTKQFSIAESLQFGWETTKNNLGFFIGLAVVWLVIVAVPNVVLRAAENVLEDAFPLSLLLYFVVAAIQTFFGVGFARILLKFVDHQTADFGELFSGSDLFASLFGATIIFGLASFVGTLLCTISGIYVLLRFHFYGLFVVDKGQSALDSLKSSSSLTEGIKLDLLVFDIVALGLNVVGVICLGVGVLVTIPITALAETYVYRALQTQMPSV